jgi:predicted HAD superfamily Cof-like phosphohydrolase
MQSIAGEFQKLAQKAEEVNSLYGECPHEEQLILAQDFLEASVDCVYALAGTVEGFGWNFERAFNKVHASNMTKLKFKLDKDKEGNFKRVTDYKPAELEDCIDV